MKIKLGPTGKYPEGKLSDHDDGELMIAVGTDRGKGIVFLEFGAPVRWLGLPKSHALELAKLIEHHARLLGEH